MANEKIEPRKGKITKLPSAKVEKTKALNKSVYGNRIREFRLLRGMNQPQLAAVLGITKNSITNWEAGTSRPELDNIVKLCAAVDISADTFFNILNRADTLSVSEWELIRSFRVLSKYDRKTVFSLVDAMIDNDAQAFREECEQNFELLSISPLAASAGTGNPLYDAYERQHVYLRVNRDVCRADEIITVNGDSMYPTFADGDALLVEHTCNITPGEIGIFVIAGEGYVKEYQLDGLHSHNLTYKTIRPSEDDNVRCIGRVLSVVSENWFASPKEQGVLDEIYAKKHNKRK